MPPVSPRVRGPIRASISPASSSSDSERPAGASARFTPCGRVIGIFSGRPGCSMPPRTHTTSDGATPKSSSRKARTHTQAVSWYSATPTLRPLRSAGAWMPRSVRMYMAVWRNAREGNAGTPT
jgi:hypothetical protein